MDEGRGKGEKLELVWLELLRQKSLLDEGDCKGLSPTGLTGDYIQPRQKVGFKCTCVSLLKLLPNIILFPTQQALKQTWKNKHTHTHTGAHRHTHTHTQTHTCTDTHTHTHTTISMHRQSQPWPLQLSYLHLWGQIIHIGPSTNTHPHPGVHGAYVQAHAVVIFKGLSYQSPWL